MIILRFRCQKTNSIFVHYAQLPGFYHPSTAGRTPSLPFRLPFFTGRVHFYAPDGTLYTQRKDVAI